MSNGLEFVFLENRDALVRFARLRGAGDGAEDLVQDVWFRLSRAPPGPVANPVSYLYRMVHNLMLDEHRSERQRLIREREWVGDVADDQMQVHGQITQADTLLAKDELALTLSQIHSLGEPTSTIFLKFRIDGIAQKEIAREMQCSLPTIEKHLQKAYRAMVEWRKVLTQYGSDDSSPSLDI